MADNRSFTLKCCDFDLSMEVAFSGGRKATGFYSDKEKFVLFWTNYPEATSFPVPLTAEEVGPIIKRWLAEVADYGKTPILDGDAERSWLFETNGWGHAPDFGWQSFLKVSPKWALYGK